MATTTVQAADTVYGVTMGVDSASQIIGLKLDGEAVAKPVHASSANIPNLVTPTTQAA